MEHETNFCFAYEREIMERRLNRVIIVPELSTFVHKIVRIELSINKTCY